MFEGFCKGVRDEGQQMEEWTTAKILSLCKIPADGLRDSVPSAVINFSLPWIR